MQSSLKKQSSLGHYEEKQCPVPNELQIRMQEGVLSFNHRSEFTCDTDQNTPFSQPPRASRGMSDNMGARPRPPQRRQMSYSHL